MAGLSQGSRVGMVEQVTADMRRNTSYVHATHCAAVYQHVLWGLDVPT